MSHSFSTIALRVQCLAYFQCLCQNNKHFSIYVSVWVFSPFFVCVNIFVTKYRERCKFHFLSLDLGKITGESKGMCLWYFFEGFYAYYKIIFQIICTNLHSHEKRMRVSVPVLLCQKCLTFKSLVYLIRKTEKSHFNFHFLNIPGEPRHFFHIISHFLFLFLGVI